MPVTDPIDSFRAVCAPVSVIVRRLEEHCKHDGMLEGLDFTPLLRTAETLGDANLPALRFNGYTHQEQHARGASTPQGRGNTPIMASATLTLSLYTKMQSGYIKTAPGLASVQSNGHLDWLALVMDAIETDWRTNTVDCLLEMTCERPHLYRIQPNQEDGESLLIESAIFMDYWPRHHCRAQRGALFGAGVVPE